jgi:hypothetical protein
MHVRFQLNAILQFTNLRFWVLPCPDPAESEQDLSRVQGVNAAKGTPIFDLIMRRHNIQKKALGLVGRTTWKAVE